MCASEGERKRDEEEKGRPPLFPVEDFHFLGLHATILKKLPGK